MIEIAPDLAIPETDFTFVASRSGGPGGQNVNKVSSRVTLLFDVEGSSSLTSEQKSRISERLANRISGEGILRVTSQVHRSQSANREEALRRFIELVQWALSEAPPRVATRVSRAAKQRRVEEKKRRGLIKAVRATKPDLDD